MSSDGAGGVGGSDGSNSANSSNDGTDGLGGLADGLGDALGGLADATGLSDALGGLADATGLSDALGGLAEALGLDARDLDGLVGAALMGAITGGLPGAIMGVVNSLVGGSLSDATRDAISASLPASVQPLANMVLDNVIGRIPGAATSSNPLGAIDTLASGVLTGKMPSLDNVSAVARDLRSLTEVGRSLVDGVARGDIAEGVQSAQALEGTLESALDHARTITAEVTGRVQRGEGLYAQGGNGRYGDAVERLAVSTARLLTQP